MKVTWLLLSFLTAVNAGQRHYEPTENQRDVLKELGVDLKDEGKMKDSIRSFSKPTHFLRSQIFCLITALPAILDWFQNSKLSSDLFRLAWTN